jgi:hypothetical protein
MGIPLHAMGSHWVPPSIATRATMHLTMVVTASGFCAFHRFFSKKVRFSQSLLHDPWCLCAQGPMDDAVEPTITGGRKIVDVCANLRQLNQPEMGDWGPRDVSDETPGRGGNRHQTLIGEVP